MAHEEAHEEAHDRAHDWATCRRIIAQHSKSFDWASRLLDAGRRNEIAALYAWCRRCDDAIDLVDPVHHAEALAGQRADLASVYAGEPQSDPVLDCFQAVVQRRGVPLDYPTALLDGMEMDVDGSIYASTDDLLVYCWRVAGAVGLMMCHVLGVSDSRASSHAAHLGIAMQLTNIARDVAEDWERRRVYLPQDSLSEDLRAWLREHVDDPSVPALPTALRDDLAASTRRLLERAERYYASADVGLGYLEPRSALAIRAARLIYAEIGRVLEARDCDVTLGRASVPARRKARLTLRALGRYVGDRRRWNDERLLAPNGVLDAADAVRLA